MFGHSEPENPFVARCVTNPVTVGCLGRGDDLDLAGREAALVRGRGCRGECVDHRLYQGVGFGLLFGV